MACLAGVLIMVSYNMSGWRTVKAILKTPKSDVTVMIVTFLLTVVFDLTIAIELGLLLAILLFLRRVMENTEIHHSASKSTLPKVRKSTPTRFSTLSKEWKCMKSTVRSSSA